MFACRSALPLSTEGTKEPKGRKKEEGIACATSSSFSLTHCDVFPKIRTGRKKGER